MRLPDFDKAFPTLFLPIVVPKCPSEDENDAVVDCFRAFLDKVTSDPTYGMFLFQETDLADVDHVLKSMRSMSRRFCDLHSSGGNDSSVDALSPSLIHSSLLELPPGGYWGMWVSAQNGVLLLQRPKANEGTQDIVRVYVWEAQAPNNKVMGTDGSVRQACPRSATCVPWERFLRMATAELLFELATTTYEKAQPMSRKAGEKFPEARDVVKPMYLAEYFLAALGGEAIPTNTIHGVHKAMKDNVVYSKGELPWRRAPVWAALKSLLHVVCVMETSKETRIHNENSQIIYKVLLQNFLAFCFEQTNKISSSATVEGCRKIVRRVAKIEQQYQSHWKESRFLKTSTSVCAKIVSRKMKLCENDWKEQCEKPVKCEVDGKFIDVENDVVHQLKSSLPILEKLIQLGEEFYQVDTNKDIAEPKGRKLLADQEMSCELLNAHIHEINATFKRWEQEPQDAVGQLHDAAVSIIEFFMGLRYKESRASVLLHDRGRADDLTIPLMRLLESYSTIGLKMYNNDPRGCGEIVLVSLALVLILDILACSHYPLLKEHDLGIKSGFLESLLFSKVENKKLLFEFEKYMSERDADSQYPSSIEQTRSFESLSVRFASTNVEMTETLKSIQDSCELSQREKKLQHQTLKERYDELQEEIRRQGSCSCRWNYNSHGHRTTRVRCQMCRLVEQAKSIQMFCYEKLLPPEKPQQLAVVYELKQPKLLVSQRGAILLLNKKFCCDEWCLDKKHFLWSAESRLARWRNNIEMPLTICELGSTRKKFSSSHYHKQYHVTKRASFVVEHDYNTILMGDVGPVNNLLSWVPKPSLFSVELKATSRYKSLEPFFNSFLHSENDVIAAKSVASEEISLTEFEKVGTLRAGARHQLIRLCSSLSQKDISLEREEIVLLVQFALWQAGPLCSLNGIVRKFSEFNSVQDSWYRQQSEILKLPSFVQDVCYQLGLTIDECKSNWANRNILLNVTHVTMHIFEHIRLQNCDTSNIAIVVEVVGRCRNIAKQWIGELIDAFSEARSDSDRQSKREAISYVAAIGIFTFADSDHLLHTSHDVGLWVYFRCICNANVAPTVLREGSGTRSHFFHAFALAETLEPRLHGLLNEDRSGLDKFFGFYFSMIGNNTRNWIQCEARHWFQSIGGDGKVVQVDVIAGNLLVNGFPPESIPRSITSHKVFSRLFNKSIFMVTPTDSFGYRTSSNVGGFFYEFYPPHENQFGEAPTIIAEASNLRAVLVPWYAFEGDLPEELVNNYSHWFVVKAPIDANIKKNCLYLCPKNYKTTSRKDLLGYPTSILQQSYALDCEKRIVVEEKSGHTLIDIRSGTFKELYSKVFSRLSPYRKIHVSISATRGDPLMIKIPVLESLKFSVDQQSCVIRSEDYPDLRVSKDQNFGSFIGIRHGLLLEGDSKAVNRYFLCPHGRVDRQSDGSVSIGIQDIRSPPFFRFEVRPELKDLHSRAKSKISTLFLAQLHAATSGILPDPFTGTTGTQRALTILRSGHCSGNLLNSVEEEDIKESIIDEARVLHEIACISHQRSEYHSMEENDSVISNYDALCATSAFAFIVATLFENLDNALKVIGKDRKSLPYLPEDLESRTSRLSRRAYFQHHEAYPKDSLLSAEEEQNRFGSSTFSCKSFLSLPYGFECSTFEVAQKIAFESQNNSYLEEPDIDCLVLLLCSKDIQKLQGFTGTATLTGGPLQCFLSLCDPTANSCTNDLHVPPFHDIWLNLYHLCQAQTDNDDKKTSISFLLTWVMMEYPQHEASLQQLSRIATYPKKFPTVPDIYRYDKPHEKMYERRLIEEAIDRSLETFEEPEPCPIGFPHLWSQWCQRKTQHKYKRDSEAKSMESEVRSKWYSEKEEICIRGYSLLNSRESIEATINSLFRRWRNARELHKFLEEVKKKLLEVTGSLQELCRNENDRVSLDHDATVDVSSYRNNFILSTSANLNSSEWDHDSIAKLRNINPYTLSLNASAVDQARYLEVSEMLFLNNSSFVNNNPNYEEVWKALVIPLARSLRLACNESDFCASDIGSLRSEIEMKLEEYGDRANSAYKEMYSFVSAIFRSETEDTPFLEMQKNAFLWDSVGPYDLLLQLSKHSTSNEIKNELISLLVSIKHLQRARRCLRLLRYGNKSIRIHLLHDLCLKFSASDPGLNEAWDAYSYPEFIMFEVDNDIAIRDTQVKVACEILKEKIDGLSGINNRLMQLNMGEGKTAVIMPIVLARAARGDKVVRATVLSSLYATNASDWQYKLGGLLNRRIYPFLFRRDLLISADGARTMLHMCKYIKKKRHIIVTVPEHRLSLENKAIELASDLTMAKDVGISERLHDVVKFFACDGREFLDESDEILSSKYQLTYTIGAPRDMEGSQLRWEIHSFIYESLTRHALSLLEDFGPDVIELGARKRESEYIGFRLLEGSNRCEEAYNAIKTCIVDDILSNLSTMKITLSKEERRKWKNCVSGRGTVDDVEFLPNSSKVIALSLRGMLEHNVLKTALFKRWRVNYGNHPSRKGFKMAVPYRAKDVAAERTEFGHPDVALSLTFAHYFQAGLKKKELHDVFEQLERLSDSDAKAEYSNWVGSARTMSEMEGFCSYEGVNIEDSVFFDTKLFPVLRKNMRVIRFWLVKIVLPVQAKQFPKRLSSTAPELCRNQQLVKYWTAVTTGFSGTDDLSLLLPPTIIQANLEELEKTNGVQLRNIIRHENNFYHHLDGEDTTEQILDVLKKVGDMNIVLDAGALVLHKSNRDFVESWLNIRKDMDAGAYFEGSSILVLTREGSHLKFDASSYYEDMSKCLLYLDEIHTRGSDFRLPWNARALLTLGKGLQKDKFVQACMRMRQLGRGQSLLFVASREVNLELENDFRLKAAINVKLGYISTILDWTISNSVKRLYDLMPYFVDQMRSTFLKANAYNKFFANPGSTCLESIANACIEDEVLELQKMYGHESGEELLPKIVDRRLNEQLLFGETSEEASTKADDSRSNLVKLANGIKGKIRDLAPRVRVPCIMLDEEQERELEQEQEEEIDVERPPPAKPRKPKFSEGLVKVLRLGQNRPELFPELCKQHLLPIGTIFSGTSFSESRVGSQLTTDEVFVTKDFVETVEGERGKDYFLKNIRWFLKFDSAPDLPIVVVSNFEAEALSIFLASEKRNLPPGEFPSLYAFAAITRFQQPRKLLKTSSCEPPVALHVCAGSIHADEELVTEVSSFLSVFPRPQTATGRKIWDELFEAKYIDRDGFVSPEHRHHVKLKLGLGGSKKGTLCNSPVKDLQRFYGDCRHLNSELSNSSIGRLLGVSELVSKYDNDVN